MKLLSLSTVLLCAISAVGQTPNRVAKFDLNGNPTNSQITEFNENVGVTNDTPSARVHIKTLYEKGTTAAEMMLKFSPPGNNGDYGFLLQSVQEGNDAADDVVFQGWNCDHSAIGEPSLCWSMERAFGTDYELHLEVTPLSAPSYRPWTWGINRTTGAAVVTTTATTHFYGGGANLHIGPTEQLAEGPFRHQANSIIFETLGNGGAPAKQARFVPHPNDSALTQLLFGDSNGVGLTNVGGVLQVEKEGSPAIVNVGQININGLKAVGARCAAIPDSTGGTDDTRAINAILACLRTQGTIAP